MKRSVAFLVLGLVLASTACAVDTGNDDVAQSEDGITGLTLAKVMAHLQYGETSEPIAIPRGQLRAVSFDGQAGDEIEAWVNGEWVGGVDPRAWLIASDRKTELAFNADAGPYTSDARVRFTLAASGKHFIAFREVAWSTSSSVRVSLEKKTSAGLPPAAAVADACVAHPWPMGGQCRDEGASSGELGPTTGARAWSRRFGRFAWDTVEAVAVSRDGSVHVLHGFYFQPNSEFRQLHYTVVAADGTRRSSQRVPVANTVRGGLALTPDGTAWLLASGTLFRADPKGDLANVATLRVAGGATRYGGPVLQVDAQGRLIGRITDRGPLPTFDPAAGTVGVAEVPDERDVQPSPWRSRPTAVPLAGGGAIRTELVATHVPPDVVRVDAAGAQMWRLDGAALLAVDRAHGRAFVERRERLEALDLATGASVWTASDGQRPEQVLVHGNGDVVVVSSRRGDRLLHIRDAAGIVKAEIDLRGGGYDIGLALDGANMTYARFGTRVVALDANGHVQFDVTDDRFFAATLAIGMNKTLYVVGQSEVSQLR